MLILIQNVITSLTATLLIISGFKKLTKKNVILYLTIIGLGDFYLSSVGLNSLLYKTLIGALIIQLCHTKWIDSFFYVTTAEIIILSATFLAGPIVYIIPNITQLGIYNIVIAFFILLTAYLSKLFLQQKRIYITVIPRQLKKYIIVTEMMTALPITIFYKCLNSKEQLLIATCLLFIYTVLLAIIITFTMKIVIQKNEIEIRKENAILQKKLLIRNYGKSLHFITPAIATMRKYIDEDNFDGLKQLYEKYISPLNTRHIIDTNIEQLKLVKMELIHALLYELLARSEKVQISVSGVIQIDDNLISEIDLFIVLSEYINNALTHINQHQDGIIKIYICQNEVGTYIEIANNCFDTNMDNLYRVTHMDFGLKYTKEILDRHSIDYSTSIESGWFIQKLELYP